MSEGWCTIESDPGVFSELLTLFGVNNAEVSEVWSLDEELTSKSYGLVFLFKYIIETDERPTISAVDDCPELFYARQVIQNACATQAILHVLLNADGIDIGQNLEELKSFTYGLDPETKGMALGNSDVIRNAHNAFAPQSAFEPDAPPKHAKSGDAYHFIAYIPFNGIVYELDGLKSGPIILGAVSQGDEWLSVAKPAIEERMMRYNATETSFALLNICPKKSLLLDEEIAAKRSELQTLECTGIDDNSLRETILMETNQLVEQRADEEQKLFKQKEENRRRRHDYLPFIITLLRKLSEQGKLDNLITTGKKRAADLQVARNKRK